VGSNGAGKTSTLRAIMGLRSPSQGEIIFGGVRIDRMSAPDIVSRGIALSPEGRRVFPRMTVHDNLLIGGYLRPKSSLHNSIERMFGFFPKLRQRRNQMAGLMSGGEQQMLAIGRILRTGAKLLLLDEPTEGLAPVIIQQIGRTIHTLKEKGFTILLVEQNFHFASTVADRYYVMEHGRVIDQFANSELDANTGKLHEYLGV
jgi:branched-chain amino acid transport system ATP-binding protein